MKWKLSALLVAALVLLTAIGTRPSSITGTFAVSRFSAPLDDYLAATENEESARYGLVADTEKRVLWFDAEQKEKTPLSLVYLHGYSATRQEIAPVAAEIAAALSANLFETRLAGHGRLREPLAEVSAEDWLRDTAEALSIGAAIGERVIVMGTSTGATLALAMLNSELMNRVDYLILMSPNLILQDRSSEILIWPGGPLLARAVIGESRSWEPRNELQATFWTTTYPTSSVIELMRLVAYARDNLPTTVRQHLLTISSPLDQVVDTVASRRYIERMAAAENKFISYSGSTDDGQHVLAGDILSPASNRFVTELVVNFVRGDEMSTTVN